MRVLRFTAAIAAAICLCSAASCSASKDKTSSSAEEPATEWYENLITPDTDSEEYDLGDYYISPNGTKLYFDPAVFPSELVLTLEKYFNSYAKRDYDTYVTCVYPSYLEEMNKFLEKDYSYDLSTSFGNQCDTLESNMGSDYTITRLKLESYEGDLTKFFESPSSCFGKDYYSEVKEEVDKFYDAMFFVIAKNANGEESSLISEYEIVFAEKDGKFYAFG